jgi:hypothetical protein
MLKQMQSLEECKIDRGAKSDDSNDIPARKPSRNERRKTKPRKITLRTSSHPTCKDSNDCRCDGDVATTLAIKDNESQVVTATPPPATEPAWQRRTQKKEGAKKGILAQVPNNDTGVMKDNDSVVPLHNNGVELSKEEADAIPREAVNDIAKQDGMSAERRDEALARLGMSAGRVADIIADDRGSGLMPLFRDGVLNGQDEAPDDPED